MTSRPRRVNQRSRLIGWENRDSLIASESSFMLVLNLLKITVRAVPFQRFILADASSLS